MRCTSALAVYTGKHEQATSITLHAARRSQSHGQKQHATGRDTRTKSRRTRSSTRGVPSHVTFARCQSLPLMNVERFARFLLIRFTEEGSCACDVSVGGGGWEPARAEVKKEARTSSAAMSPSDRLSRQVRFGTASCQAPDVSDIF